MSLIGLLLVVLIVCVVLWAVRALLGAFVVGEPIATVVYVIVVVIVLLWLLQAFNGGVHVGAGYGIR